MLECKTAPSGRRSLDHEFARRLLVYTTVYTTATIAIYYYYHARKLIYLFYRLMEDRRLSWTLWSWWVTCRDGSLFRTDGHQSQSY